MKNLVKYRIYLLVEIEKTKQQRQFKSNINAFTLDAPNLLNNIETNKLAKERPK